MSYCHSTKAAIFDLDGTLLDSMGVWNQIDIDFLGKRGLAVPDDYMATVASMQFRQIAEYTIDRFGLKDTPEALMAEWNEMAREAYATTVKAKPGAIEYLYELKTAGVRLGVATTLLLELREAALGHLGMRDLFDAIVSVDDAHGVGKDRPDVYLLAASRLGAAPADCTVFEDLLAGIRSAKSAGMRVWAMYDDSSAADWPEITAIADGTLHDFRDAPRL
ncbi:HAD family phosphatase [Bifidobacterium sp. SO4]|uniref:HAD family hydrolase n=1 Tax=Bifidobacterium sp. SO4 TaxID=2809030 RepID=UPI001BDCF3B3|nr:HAD family phosphatase [Bifidobacterium sp. SO4]MBT1171177.1 HAD family phosphatase [Bifidobacterium sp. SO4]